MIEQPQWKRKLFHLSGIFIPIIIFIDGLDHPSITYFIDNTRTFSFITLSFLTITITLLDFARVKTGFLQGLFVKMAKYLVKPKEMYQMSSVPPFLLSSTIVVAFFPKEIIVMAMLCLLIGDPMASLMGTRYGKTILYKGRTLLGTLSGITASFISCAIFLSFVTYNSQTLFILWNAQGIYLNTWFMILGGIIVGFILELVGGEGIFLDDNMLITLSVPMTMVLIWSTLENQAFGKYIFSLHELLHPI